MILLTSLVWLYSSEIGCCLGDGWIRSWLLCLVWAGRNLIHLTHQLTTVFNFLKSLNAVSVDLVEIVKLILQAKIFSSLKDLGCNIISVVVKHNVFEEFVFLRRVLHKDNAKFFELIFWHSIDSLFNNSWTVLLLTEFGQILSYKLIDTTDSYIHNLWLPFW